MRSPATDSIEPYRKQAYVFDQMNGAQSDGPAFLINIHRVDSAADAEAYVARLTAMARYLDQSIAEAKDRQARGILPPKWVFPYVIADSKNVISGAPFGPGKDSALFADLKAKVGKLDIAPAEKARLIDAGRRALDRRCPPRLPPRDRADGGAAARRRHRRRHLALPQRRRAICDAGPLLHDHRHDPRPDPRAGPGAGRADPRRDARDHGEGRLQGHAAAILRPHADQPRRLLFERRRRAAALSRRNAESQGRDREPSFRNISGRFPKPRWWSSRSSRSARNRRARPSIRTRRPTGHGPGPITSTSTI